LTELAKLRAYVRMGDDEAEQEITAGLAIAGCGVYPVTVGNEAFWARICEIEGERHTTPAGYTYMETHSGFAFSWLPVDGERPFGAGADGKP
jgi:hypothetical protein